MIYKVCCRLISCDVIRCRALALISMGGDVPLMGHLFASRTSDGPFPFYTINKFITVYKLQGNRDNIYNLIGEQFGLISTKNVIDA